MADQVDEIKSKVDIVSLIGEHLELKKAGRNFKALCPFHSEKTPSFMVSPEMQIYKCFGCQKGGDAISFLQEYEGMDFYEALKFLAQRVGVKLKPLSSHQKGIKETLFKINQIVQYFYSYLLLNHPVGKNALEYLRSARGLEPDTLKTFGLGYSPEHPFALKKFLIDKKKINPKDLERVGLVNVRGRDLTDRFRGRVVFPLLDHRANIVGFAGRLLPKDEGKNLAKYINTPETEIYHKGRVLYGLNLTKGEIKKAKTAVIVEGELDLISSWQAGVKNITAIKGSALTIDQARLLSRYAENVILMLDSDPAGDDASRRGVEVAEREGMEVKVAKIAGYKDPDEAARSNPVSLKNAIAQAEGAWDYIINSIFAKHKSDSGSDAAKISKEIVPVLLRISDKIVQAHFIELVAKKLDVPVDAVREQIFSTKEAVSSKDKLEVLAKPSAKTRRELLEERFLALCFRQNPKILLAKTLLKLVKSPFAKRIVEEIQKNPKVAKKFDPSVFAAKLPKELVEGYIDLILKDIRGLEEETPENLEKELKLVERELKVVDAKEKMAKLARRIKELERVKDRQEIRKTQESFGKLTKKLHDLESGDFKGIIL